VRPIGRSALASDRGRRDRECMMSGESSFSISIELDVALSEEDELACCEEEEEDVF